LLRGKIIKSKSFWKATWKSALLLLMILLLAGCHQESSDLTAVANPTQNTYGLSADAFNTLNSLKKINDYPLYEMHFSGTYENSGLSRFPDQTEFGCSLFAALGDEKNPVFGRNFDWSFSPAMVLYNDPSDGYASVSMVNIAFLNNAPKDKGSLQKLAEISVPKRALLLDAVRFPLDGMNEYGLFIGMAAVEESVADYDPSRPGINSLSIMREILDHARTADEAVTIFSKFNIYFTGGPPIHYLIADSLGKSVVIEYIEGKMEIIPNEKAWQLATNHLLFGGMKGQGSSGDRFDTMNEQLVKSQGIINQSEAMNLLNEVSQPTTGTQWSVVYDVKTGSMNVVMARDYADINTFYLLMKKQ